MNKVPYNSIIKCTDLYYRGKKESENLQFPDSLYGMKESSAFWTSLYKSALKGLNIGEGAGVSRSGEDNVFRLIRAVYQKSENGLVLFDVGANSGMYADALSNEYPKSTIHCFEPGKFTFTSLKENLQDLKNIIYNNAAIGKKEGTATLHYDREGSGIASLYQRQLDYFGINFSKSESVNVVTLDKYCKDHKIDFIHLLKMDIEGNEYNALIGAREMLETGRIGLIQFEFGGCNIDSRTFFRDFWNLLHKDYNIYRIMKDGFLPIEKYEETLECFITTNYLCSLKKLGGLGENSKL